MHSEMMKLFEEAKVLLPQMLALLVQKYLLYWYKSTWRRHHPFILSSMRVIVQAHLHILQSIHTPNYSTEIASYLLVVHVILLASQYMPDESRVVHLLSTSGDLTQKKIPGLWVFHLLVLSSPSLCHTLPQQSIVLQELGSVIEVTERPHEDDLFRNQVVAAPLTSASMVNKVVRSPGHIEL